MGDPGSIPGSGRSPGEGNGNPLQYSCLEKNGGLSQACPAARTTGVAPSGEEQGREALNEQLVDPWGGNHGWDLWSRGVWEPLLHHLGYQGAAVKGHVLVVI